jgi:hypothetical protein
LAISLGDLWPKISIEPSAAAEPQNPFSGVFKIINDQNYELTNVSVEVSLRCARIGRGDATSPMDRCEPSMHTAEKLWAHHKFQPHESYEITPGNLLFVTPPTALLYAQMSFYISYRPWRFPFQMTKELRFQSRRTSDGKMEWLHLPAD